VQRTVICTPRTCRRRVAVPAPISYPLSR